VTSRAERYLEQLLAAVSDRPADLTEILDAIPVPIYMTDTDGAVTYWNAACAQFAGRKPELGQDRWCVTWQLYTMAGEPLAHENCPMAVAIREGKPQRGDVAIALRPDGSRRAFTPYPTPLYDQSGKLRGAVNMLIDVTDEQIRELAAQAERCTRLATSVTDHRAARILTDMAASYSATIETLKEHAS
jgi:PAS domain S-box-containing protein